MNKQDEKRIQAKKPAVFGPQYVALLNDIKNDIRVSRTRAVLAANREQIKLYWRIGKKIVEQQEKLG